MNGIKFRQRIESFFLAEMITVSKVVAFAEGKT
jgi:hypothetical protein